VKFKDNSGKKNPFDKSEAEDVNSASGSLSWENDDNPPTADIMILQESMYFHKIMVEYPEN
jgi:hypothetical protein